VRSRQRIRAYAAAAGMLFLAAPLRAQNAPCLRRTVVANVVDEKGNPLPGLTAADFQAKFRGKPVKILSATFDQQPRRILILLDTSGSMEEHFRNRHVPIIDALRLFVARAAPGDFLAFATFSKALQTRVDFSRIRDPFEVQFQAIQPKKEKHSGGARRTALWDALVAAAVLFQSPKAGDTIVLISDGGDNESKVSAENAEKTLLGAGVRLFVLLLTEPPESPPTPEEEEGPGTLRRLAQATGGIVLETWEEASTVIRPRLTFLTSPEDTKKAVANLRQQVDASYRLDIELPEAVDKVRGWDLKLADNNTARERHLEFYFQQKLAPCSGAGR
jgi:VWA domain-containing protein